MHEGDHKPPTAKTDEADSHGWEERTSAESTRPSIWTRRTDAPAQTRSETPAEPRLKSETARPVESYRPADEAKVEASQPDREDEAITIAPTDQSQA